MTSDIPSPAASRSHLGDYHHHGEATSSRSSVHTPISQPHVSRISHHNATSTGVEAMDENGDQPVARHPAGAVEDLESQTGPTRRGGNDPYNLSLAFKTDEQLDEIKANTARKRTGAASSGIEKLTSTLRARRVQTFYHKQNDTIKQMLKTVEEHSIDAQNEAGDDNLRVKIAVVGSLIANICLAILQIYGAVTSGSLSLFTTMADAIFDPLSNLTLILVQHSMKRVDPNRFPSGKARLETMGNITFCAMMTAVSAILIAFSCQDISNRIGTSEVNGFNLPSVIAVCVAFATKLALFFYCWGIKDKYSQVNILWQDHRNDLLINGFGVLTSVGGSKLTWWIDPMGAIIISLVISYAWLYQAFKEFMTLVGRAADIDVHRLITYVCLTYSDAILGIDTVRVYHSGPKLIAEIDIVMDPADPLRTTHDVSEGLQTELEKLPNIERAYVHVDYETTHKPEHSYRKDL